MDFTHNGKDPSKFIEKAKKQAKRIFQLSKTTPDNSFKVKSLSDAQQLLAKINGFPDWHAMNTYVFREPEVLSKDSLLTTNDKHESDFTNALTYPLNVNNVPYRNTKESLQSSILLVLNLDVLNTLELFNKLKDELEFTLNLNYQNVNFTFVQNSFFTNENAYSLVNVAKEFDISEAEAMNFVFYGKNASNQKIKKTERAFLLKISTNKNALKNYRGDLSAEEMHINFCKNIKAIFESNFSIHRNKKNYYNRASFLNEDPFFMLDTSKSFTWSYLVEKNDFSHINETSRDYEIVKKFIFLLDYLISEKMDIQINFDFNGYFNFFVADENYFKTLKEAFISTKRFPERTLLIEADWNLLHERNTESLSKVGLGFKKFSDNEIFRFNLFSENNKLPVVIWAENNQKPSEDLLEWIVLDNTFNANNANKDSKTLVFAENYDVNFFKKRVSPHLKFKNINFDCYESTKLPNFFITPIGINYINEEMAIAMFSSLKSFIPNCENLNYKDSLLLIELFKTFNKELEKKNSLDFHTHVNRFNLSEEQISKIYKLLGADNLKKGKSFLYVIRKLWLKNEQDLAQALQHQITFDVEKASEYISSLSLETLVTINKNLQNEKNINSETSKERLLELQENLAVGLSLYIQKVEKDLNKFIGFSLSSDCDFLVVNLKTSEKNDIFDFAKNYLMYLGSVFFLKSFISLPSPKNLTEKSNNNEFISKFYPSFKKNWAILRADDLEGEFLSEVMKNIENENASLIYTTERLPISFMSYTATKFVQTTIDRVVSENSVKDVWGLETEVGDGSISTMLLEFNRNLH